MAIQTIDIGSGKKWLDINDPTDEELEALGREYGINRHIIHDCLDPTHLPKYEQLNNATFIIVRIFTGNIKMHLDSMQELTTKVAIFYSEDFLLTLHRLDLDCLKHIRKEEDEVESDTTGNIVTRIVSHAMQSYEKPALLLSDQVDEYETRVLLKATKPALLRGLYFLKRKGSTCRKVLLLSADLIRFLDTTSADDSLVQDVRDEHTKLITLYDSVVEDVANLLNTYLSLSAQKTNDVMKVLTIFSVFFMPLTFIVGVYGMNFKYMPELGHRWAYPTVLVGMAVIVVAIYIWFKRKHWL